MEKTIQKWMKNKKVLFAIIGAGILLIACAVVVLLFFLIRDPEAMAKDSLETVLAQPATLIEGEEVPEIVAVMDEAQGYEWLSFTEGDGEATATLRVFAPDLYAAAQKVAALQNESREQMEERLLEELKKAPIVEQEMELLFVETDGEYQPVLTSEFVDAYYGGAVRIKEEYLLGLVEEGAY